MDAWRQNFQEQNQKSFSKIQRLRQAIAIVQNDNQQILSELEPYEKWMDDAYDYIAKYQHSDSDWDYEEEEDTSDSKIDDDDSNFDCSDDQNSQSKQRDSCITNNRQLLPNSQPLQISHPFDSLHHVEQASPLNQVLSQPNTQPFSANSENQKNAKDTNDNVYYVPKILIPEFCFIPQQEQTTANQDEAAKTNEEPASNQKETVESRTSTPSNDNPPLLTSTATQETNKQSFAFLPGTQNLATPSSLNQTKMTAQSQNDHSRPLLFHQSHPSPISQPRLVTQNAQTQVAQIPAKITPKSQNNDSQPMQFPQKPQTPLSQPETNITPKSQNNDSQFAISVQNQQTVVSQPQTNITPKSQNNDSRPTFSQQSHQTPVSPLQMNMAAKSPNDKSDPKHCLQNSQTQVAQMPAQITTKSQENDSQPMQFHQKLQTPLSQPQTGITPKSQNNVSQPTPLYQNHQAQIAQPQTNITPKSPNNVSQPAPLSQNHQAQISLPQTNITPKSQNNVSQPAPLSQNHQAQISLPQTNITPKSQNNVSQPAPLSQNHQAQIAQPQTNMTSKSVDDNSQRMMLQQQSKKRAEESIQPPDFTNNLEMANPARLFHSVSQDPRLGSVHSNTTKNIPSVIMPSSKSDTQLNKQSVQSYPPTASTTVTNTNQNATPNSNQATQNYKMIQVNQNLPPGQYLLSIPILLSTKTSMNSHQILQTIGQTTKVLHHYLSQSPDYSVQLPLNNQFSVLKMDSLLPRADNQAAHIRTPQNDTSQPTHQSLYKSQDQVNSLPANQSNLKNNYPVYSAVSHQNPQHQTNPQTEPPASQQHVLQSKERIQATLVNQSNAHNIHVVPSTVPPSIPQHRTNQGSSSSSNQHQANSQIKPPASQQHVLENKERIQATLVNQSNGHNLQVVPSTVPPSIPQNRTNRESSYSSNQHQTNSQIKPPANMQHVLDNKEQIQATLINQSNAQNIRVVPSTVPQNRTNLESSYSSNQHQTNPPTEPPASQQHVLQSKERIQATLINQSNAQNIHVVPSTVPPSIPQNRTNRGSSYSSNQHQTNPQMEPPANMQHVLDNKEQIQAILVNQSNGQNIRAVPSTVPPSIPQNRTNLESPYSSNQHTELLKKNGMPASTAKQSNGQSNVHKAPTNSLLIAQQQESDAFLMASQNQTTPKPNYNFIHPQPFKDIIPSQNRDLPKLKKNSQASSQNDQTEILRRYLVDILSQIRNENGANFINQLSTSNSSAPPKE